MTQRTRSVLITGCSADGLGYGLAEQFHASGLRVFATARNPAKMAGLPEQGIETLTLDVLSDSSIKSCVEEVSKLTGGKLDILVNNAGGGYNMPVADIDVNEAKKLFDLNVWSVITITQAFLPMLLKSKGMIVNQTSISAVEPTPHNSVYNTSKAAAAMFSAHMRLELEPFGIKVVDLRTGCVHTKFHDNHQGGNASLPPNSIYLPVKEQTESAMRNAFPYRQNLDEWSKAVVDDLLKPSPRSHIWRGVGAWSTWFYCTFFSSTWWDNALRKEVGLDLLGKRLKGAEKA